MKKQKLEYTELRSLESVIEQLQGLVEGLRLGALSITRGERQLSLGPDAVVEFALKAEQTSKQERIELSLEWQRQYLSIGSGAPPRPEESPPPIGAGEPGELDREPVEAEAVVVMEREAVVGVEAEAVAGVDPEAESQVDEYDVEVEEYVPEEVDEEAVTLRLGTSPARAQPERPADADAAKYQELYAAARVADAEGQPHLDERRFVESLAALGVDPLLRHELCELARQADAENRASLFKEAAISDLIAQALSGAA